MLYGILLYPELVYVGCTRDGADMTTVWLEADVQNLHFTVKNTPAVKRKMVWSFYCKITNHVTNPLATRHWIYRLHV